MPTHLSMSRKAYQVGAVPQFEMSVIIPTFNRFHSLLETLEALSQQTLETDRYEVIVVDDGATDTTRRVASRSYAFNFRYVRQENQGSAAARNHGAEVSRGRNLVFIDDDITLGHRYLEVILKVLRQERKCLYMGTFSPYLTEDSSNFARSYPRVFPTEYPDLPTDQNVSFADCSSNNLAVGRQAFFNIGKWHDVLGDGPTLWGDVEFGYRAWKQDFDFLRVPAARLVHRDHSTANLQSACERASHISTVVHKLFERYPEIRQHLPMYTDKEPVLWKVDPPQVIVRKIARMAMSQLVSQRAVVRRLLKLIAGRPLIKGVQSLRISRRQPTGAEQRSKGG